MRANFKELKQKTGVSGKMFADIYKAWKRMTYRCYNPSNASYHNYTSKGIDVCDEWKGSFEPFLIWAIESGWKEGLSLDRIDNDKGYSPSNCRWATAKDQARNRGTCIYLTHNGITKCLMEWCEEFGVPHYLPLNRINRGCKDFDKLFAKVDYRTGGELYFRH